jgi:hypothetical protein
VTEKIASEDKKSKCHRPNEASTSQTSSLSLSSKRHEKCLMTKEKKMKKSKKIESEKEEEEDDLGLDNLSKKDMVKIKKLFERVQEEELQLEQEEEFLIGKIDSRL